MGDGAGRGGGGGRSPKNPKRGHFTIGKLIGVKFFGMPGLIDGLIHINWDYRLRPGGRLRAGGKFKVWEWSNHETLITILIKERWRNLFNEMAPSLPERVYQKRVSPGEVKSRVKYLVINYQIYIKPESKFCSCN